MIQTQTPPPGDEPKPSMSQIREQLYDSIREVLDRYKETLGVQEDQIAFTLGTIVIDEIHGMDEHGQVEFAEHLHAGQTFQARSKAIQFMKKRVFH